MVGANGCLFSIVDMMRKSWDLWMMGCAIPPFSQATFEVLPMVPIFPNDHLCIHNLEAFE